ncbi:hypothetical protein ACJRO7_015210 [Eucalyptus globulus]|uniref:Uncharacterized protein n=1 Tax=Eucalyptus globulus TaxID=34317 RepID=A0ABD3L6N4_EUCGL
MGSAVDSTTILPIGLEIRPGRPRWIRGRTEGLGASTADVELPQNTLHLQHRSRLHRHSGVVHGPRSSAAFLDLDGEVQSAMIDLKSRQGS